MWTMAVGMDVDYWWWSSSLVIYSSKLAQCLITLYGTSLTSGSLLRWLLRWVGSDWSWSGQKALDTGKSPGLLQWSTATPRLVFDKGILFSSLSSRLHVVAVLPLYMQNRAPTFSPKVRIYRGVNFPPLGFSFFLVKKSDISLGRPRPAAVAPAPFKPAPWRYPDFPDASAPRPATHPFTWVVLFGFLKSFPK